MIFEMTGRVQWRMLLRDFVCDAETWQLLVASPTFYEQWMINRIAYIIYYITVEYSEYCFMAAARNLLTLGIVEVLTILC